MVGFLVSGVVMVASCCVMTWMSRWFAVGADAQARPLLAFVALMSGMFVVHLIAFRQARRLEEHRARTVWLVLWVVAIVSRMLMLPSHPIQEVDLYRYLWDGQAVVRGISPYRYAPEAVVDAIERGTSDPALSELAGHARQHPSVELILRRVHFSELPTPYPPVSQAVFSLVAATTPADADVHLHVVAMKSVIVLFDVGVILLLCWMLRMAGLSIAWAVTYAWNPLVLKEFAGSGHLDSIAVFFAVLSVALCLAAIKRRSTKAWRWAALCLALGTGAKLYPVVLFPLLAWACYRREGFRTVVVATAVFAGTLTLAFSPTNWFGGGDFARSEATSAQVDAVGETFDLSPPIPVEEVASAAGLIASTESSDGISAFLSRWEMNDLVFMLIVENLRTDPPSPWFVVVPMNWRTGVNDSVGEAIGINREQAAFTIARLMTALLYAAAGLFILSRVQSESMISFGRAAFLLVAWFWLLLPTLNPWYWTWALPLICFAGNRGWLLVSGMLPLYYLRFWCIYHADNWPLSVAPYGGARFFDYVLVFVEHLPWMFAITFVYWTGRNKGSRSSAHASEAAAGNAI